ATIVDGDVVGARREITVIDSPAPR
ncbi:MAG: hypothetical protein QOH17_2716, partial [Pseudonocardiales bacterium]|nr:hypothetical protein [Pseudonocardiales bacterium]